MLSWKLWLAVCRSFPPIWRVCREWSGTVTPAGWSQSMTQRHWPLRWIRRSPIARNFVAAVNAHAR